MHRFRKKSDAKRPPHLQAASSSEYEPHIERRELGRAPESLPELPSASDFRTSLILTDLSRRFTLLGVTARESVSVDALRTRLAEQRARGAENQISEEEENMIMESLGLRSTVGSDAEDEYPSSVSARSAMSFGSSATSVSSKRYSNNLLGSGRPRDYMRSLASSKTASMRTADSSRTHTTSFDSTEPGTPDVDASSEMLVVRSAPLNPPAPYGGPPLSVAEYRMSKAFGPSALRRASLALEEAIRAIEEEAEDEIVMPRSTAVARRSLEPQRQSPEARDPDSIRTSKHLEAGMAISSDKHIILEPESPRASPIPSRIVPGYIPGMPRPMTPKDTVESDDQRSYSTTPRATSPILPSLVSPSPIVPSHLSSSVIRIESLPSRQARSSSPNVTSPMFLQRTLNGRYTPEETQRAESSLSGEFEGPLNSSILGRRRPASPLSGTAYQSMSVSARPHIREASWISDTSANSERSANRSLRSPALPDSPLIGPGHATMSSFSSTFSTASSFESPRPMSSIDIGTAALSSSRAMRSPTPTQGSGRSPTTGTFPNLDKTSKNGSRRSSKQNTPSSPFSLGPFQPLVFSPMANSSRSSLESTGSSYHSWDGEQKERSTTLFSDIDPQRPLWHDISASGQDTYASSPDLEDADNIIMKYGLKTKDFMAIQEKLVGAAIAKTMSPDPQHRAPSLRRRRPSTSQSNYSLNGRIGSPIQSPTSSTPIADQYSALLNSVVDSLQSPTKSHLLARIDTTTNEAQSDNDSPTTRRNRDLAQVLFGQQEKEDEKMSSSVLTVSTSAHSYPHSAPLNSSFPMHTASEGPASAASATWPYQPSRNPSTPKLPQSAQEHADLAREVQRKADAAMVALQKQPSSSNLALAPKASASRKRISPNQISTPQLVSASTSVDTIPLPSPVTVTGGQSKIGSRLRRLRGSLRAKTTLPTADDITPFPMDLRSPPPAQTARYDPAKFRAPGGPIAASATELVGFKVPLPSPPASAGPGLKGFMARFRGKQRASEPQPEFDHRVSQQQSPHSSLSSSGNLLVQPTIWSSHHSPVNNGPLDMAPTSSEIESRRTSPAPIPTHSASMPLPRTPTSPLYSSRVHRSSSNTEGKDPDESLAIRQLFDAASNLGLDQSALNDLLARSGSTSSRSTEWTMLTRNNSNAASRPELPHDKARNGENSLFVSHKAQSTAPPDPAEGQTLQPNHARRPRADAPDKSAIIRRTIIFPSESRSSTIDLSVLIRKNSSRRRRASATSVSSRSVHDRAPTPPPRASSGRRFSTDLVSPPVPQLPQSLSLQPDRLLLPPAQVGGHVEKSSSAYDSLYDMYSSDKIPSSPAKDGQQIGPISESGPAVEVIELANGETIWSIVNGLRDEDDDADAYANRASFASEYSIREGGDGVQVFFKEHGRKGSSSSFLPRKKPVPGNSRPETKVFYSSSAQIGRLIENLSQGMEAGSFNILPNHQLGHSTASSLSETDINWTVEERLEHMLHGLR